MREFSSDVTRKIRSCLVVLTALWEQGPAVAELVLARVQPSLGDGEEPPRFLAQILALGRLLPAELDLMVELDQKLLDENELRATLLEARDNDVAKLVQKVLGLRRIVTGHYAAPAEGSSASSDACATNRSRCCGAQS